jgi:flagellar hook-basal body complex protein FliE
MVKEIVGVGLRNIPELQKQQPVAKDGKSFGDFLTESIQKVNDLQKGADAHVEQIAKGEEGPALQEAMVAVEKADVAFKLMMEVRQKILDAYKEISNMQV